MEPHTRNALFRFLLVLLLVWLGWTCLKEATTILVVLICLFLSSIVLLTTTQQAVLTRLWTTFVHCFLQLSEQLIGNIDPSSRRIVLLGKTGNGKSSAGNTILGVGDAFHEEASFGSVTDECSLVSGDRFGQTLHVIDTPGLFDTTKSFVENAKELFNCLSLANPGPHVFILVVRIGRYSREDDDAYNYFKTILSEEIFKTGILLFTHGDRIPRTSTLQSFIRESSANNQYFKILCEEFDGRICVVNNRNRENDDQVKILLLMIDRITNSGEIFTASESFELKLDLIREIEKYTTLDFKEQMAAYTKLMAERKKLPGKLRQTANAFGVGVGVGAAALAIGSPIGRKVSLFAGAAAFVYSKRSDIMSYVSSKFKPKPKPKQD